MATADSVSEKTGPQPVIRFRHAVRSDVGRHRTENQDSYAFVYSKESGLFIVADGMGGARGGATASAVAVDIITKEAVNSDGLVTPETLRQAIEKANSAIFDRSRKNEKLTGMGTTVVALAMCGAKAFVAHVGDSRIYHLKGGRLTRLTRDHTLVQELIDSGAISNDQAENHPIAHMLTRSLGPVGAVDVELNELEQPVEPGDRFLLCCDGLYNMVTEGEIEEIVSSRDPDQAVLDLVDLANDRGGTDNITVEVIDVFAGSEGEDPSIPPDQQRSFTSAEHLNGNYGTPELDADEPIKLSEEQVVNESIAAPRTAYDSIIFGETPTADDIRRHEEAVRETQRDAESEELEEVEPEATLSPEQRQQHVQVRALAFLVLALAFITYLIVTDNPRTSTSPEGLTTASSLSDTSSVSKTASAVDTELERAALERELEASASSESSILVSAASVSSQTVHSEIITIRDKTLSFSAESVSSASATVSSADAWPSANVIPAGTKLLSEDDVLVAPPKSSNSEQGGTGSAPSPLYTAGASSVDPEVARAIAEASNIAIPAPPPVADTATSVAVDQPIVWEHEEIKLARASESSAVSQSAPVAVSSSAASASSILLSDREKQQVLVSKIDTRERIANVDAKLQQFSISSEKESKGRADEIEKQLLVVNDGIRQTMENLETAKRRFKVWSERKEALKTKDPKELAGEVALSSVQVKRKKEAFEVASLRYLDAVELWRENPGNDQGASQMASLGKELESRRVELSEAITSAVDTAIDQARFDISEFSLVKEDLERRRDRLNRHAGIAKVKPLTNTKARMERQRELLDERTKLNAKLKELRAQLSDEEEVSFRRSLALRVLGMK